MTEPTRQARPGRPEGTARDLRICFLGDSLTAGVGDPGALGWVGRVAIATRNRGIALTAYNLGVRRDTSADARARWQAETAARLRAGDDRRIVLAVGVNDTTLADGRPRVAPRQTISHVREIVTGAAARGWDALLVGPPPVLDPAQTERITQLSAQLASACEDLSTPYIPAAEALVAFPPWFEEMRRGDGAHPAERGYQRLAALVLERGWWPWLGLGDPAPAGGPR